MTVMISTRGSWKRGGKGARSLGPTCASFYAGCCLTPRRCCMRSGRRSSSAMSSHRRQAPT